ncbi:DUF1080 domain-containing protein [Chitinophaga silvatica]|uniref:non-reducing end alpha-L-arabinofuranosidase n=1 Tax=Chitinophaga silvatica TaxID=2282649 RepID=A0A3E1Y4B0_9BACT|nr:beta-L-arabinofuranosidase domain-containing protein [Chitinophaga silvatica]RFS19524.1 DUF1080 domain-containing protein [Chitinophaga silvatica]
MRRFPFPVLLILLVYAPKKLSAQEHAKYPVTRVPLQKVRVDDPFWSPNLKKWADITVTDVLNKFQGDYIPDRDDLIAEKNATGRTRDAFQNFDLVAQGKKNSGGSDGPPWYDGLIYETISGASDLLITHPSPSLEKRLDSCIRRIAAAQDADPDGYINTWTTLNHNNQRWGTNGGNDRWQHDVYNAGMLVEAGVHHYNATGKVNLLSVAVKMANYMCRVMGPAPKYNIMPAHAGPEEAFLELYQLFHTQPALKKKLNIHVSEDDYFLLSKYWIEMRGHYADADGSRLRTSFGSYNQDHLPVFQQKTIEGHAVRATLLGTAIAATAGLNSNSNYIQTADNYWNNMIGQRLFITGGQGAIANDEKFGDDYFLPESAYLETCAAVGAGFFSERMFELKATGKYIDEFERVLYNNILSGISIDGRHYNYENPLISINNQRWSWHSCPCCPPMFLKMMGALPSFIYATDSTGLYVNLFIGSTATTKIGNTQVAIKQQTAGPWTGKTKITLSTQNPSVFNLRIRIPGWANGKENPFDLYQSKTTDSVSLLVNGHKTAINLVNGYAAINRKWKTGDQIELIFSVKPRLVYPSAAIKTLEGKAAIAAGPLVYAIEDRDELEHPELNSNPDFNVEAVNSALGEINIIKSTFKVNGIAKTLTAIPFYSIGNRGKANHTVWFSVPHNNNITVEANNVLNTITPHLYGSNIEDVNHEIYGGFYEQRIFGESFEEPAVGVNFRDWKRYTGFWTSNGSEVDGIAIRPGRNTTRIMGPKKIRIGVEPDESAKLIYSPLILNNGTVSVELKFSGNGNGNGGLLLGVKKAGAGADNFIGYEISLARDGKKIVLGYHNNNFRLLKEVPVSVNPESWNQLSVTVQNENLNITLNNSAESVLTWKTDDITTLNGNIGIRTWQSDIDFRKAQINNKYIPLTVPEQQMVSYNWDAVVGQDVKASFAIDSAEAMNGKQSQIIEFIAGKGRAGIANRGLNRWGIAVQEYHELQGSLWMNYNSLKGPVTVALESNDGAITYATRELKPGKKGWQKYSFTFQPTKTDNNARFVIYLNGKGKCRIDQVRLASTASNTFHGLPVRKDIGEAIQQEGVKFLRYAGTMVNAPEYKFSKMLGPVDQRPPYAGHWNKYSTNGFGIEEFLQYCEAAEIVPVFTINIEESPEDVAYMIEYLNGNSQSAGGKQRMLNGHAAPYQVKNIEIGNEEVIFEGDDDQLYQHYIDRFLLLEESIHRKDPEIQLVNAAWWRPGSPNMERVFKALNGKAAYWDLHVDADQADSGNRTYKILKEMQDAFHSWDQRTTMKVAVFEENGGLHNLQRALGHATNLNAIRKMGDFVLTSTPANGLQADGQNDNSWDQGQIFFTPDKVWGQPPFYAQQMAASAHQPLLVKSAVNGSLDVTATRSEDGNKLVLHVVNTAKTSKTSELVIQQFMNRLPTVTVYTLKGQLADENTVDHPEKIKVQTRELKVSADEKLEFTFEPYSYTILEFSR